MQVYNICIERGNEVNISVKGLNTDTYLIRYSEDLVIEF